jgi:hypothetical protein
MRIAKKIPKRLDRWEAARLMVVELDGGKSQRQLAEEIGRDQSLISRCAKVWRKWGDEYTHHLASQAQKSRSEAQGEILTGALNFSFNDRYALVEISPGIDPLRRLSYDQTRRGANPAECLPVDHSPMNFRRRYGVNHRDADYYARRVVLAARLEPLMTDPGRRADMDSMIVNGRQVWYRKGQDPAVVAQWAGQVGDRCESVYEGCWCGLDVGHDGPHECPASEVCGQEAWTTEEADKWMADVKAGRVE